MTGEHDLDGLPETYALALRLRDEGLDNAAIARVLDIESESVAPLLTLAESKLAGLTQDPSGGLANDNVRGHS
jgi:DNA-directed RNA polymerase specialized sigma24 family protein